MRLVMAIVFFSETPYKEGGEEIDRPVPLEDLSVPTGTVETQGLGGLV